MKTKRHKVTVFLVPKAEDKGFIALAPLFTDAVTSGDTREEALLAAKEAIELALKCGEDRDEDLEFSYSPGSEISEIEVEAPADDPAVLQDT